jgi:hypothetical protein
LHVNGAFQVFFVMSFLNLELLPFVGMPHEFVGKTESAGLGSDGCSLAISESNRGPGASHWNK